MGMYDLDSIDETGKRVFSLIFLGDKEIAALLRINVRTVESRICRIMRVFKIKNRTALALRGLMEGLTIDWVLLDNLSTGELNWLIYPADHKIGCRGPRTSFVCTTDSMYYRDVRPS